MVVGGLREKVEVKEVSANVLLPGGTPTVERPAPRSLVSGKILYVSICYHLSRIPRG